MAYNSFKTTPKPGSVTEVAEGIFLVRMALPFALDHINLWLLDDGDGWVLIDTGINTAAVRSTWRKIFSRFLKGKTITRIIVTHFHPDHAGLAGWFCDKLKIVLSMPFAEWTYGRMLYLDQTKSKKIAAEEFFKRAGVEERFVSLLNDRTEKYRVFMSPLPTSIKVITAGDTFIIGGNRWRVLIGAGHSPSQACLYCEEKRVFISSDQVLPKISPNISVPLFAPDSNPLADFLLSLDELEREIPADVLTLPSHNWPFWQLHSRLEQLKKHHKKRLHEIAETCRVPETAYTIMQSLFRRELDSHEMVFAVGETIAHLNFLINEGILIRALRSDGVYMYKSLR